MRSPPSTTRGTEDADVTIVACILEAYRTRPGLPWTSSGSRTPFPNLAQTASDRVASDCLAPKGAQAPRLDAPLEPPSDLRWVGVHAFLHADLRSGQRRPRAERCRTGARLLAWSRRTGHFCPRSCCQ